MATNFQRFADAFGHLDKLRFLRVKTIADLKANKDKMISGVTKIFVDENLQLYYIFDHFEKKYCAKCWDDHIMPIVKGTNKTFILQTCLDKCTFTID